MWYKIIFYGMAFILANVVTAIAFYFDDRGDEN